MPALPETTDLPKMFTVPRALTLLALISLSAEGLAANDFVIMKNGDRITGDIKRIWDGEVTIEPEYSDEFQVDLPLVERIESDRDFETGVWQGLPRGLIESRFFAQRKVVEFRSG